MTDLKVKIKVETFCHATEDLNKVLKSIQNVIGLEPQKYKLSKLLGHWKNPIIHVYVEINEQEAISILKNLFSKMDEKDKKIIFHNKELYMDEQGKMYLRFDKQEAYNGRLMLSSSDDIIKVVIQIQNVRKEKIIETYKYLGIFHE